MRAIVYTSRTGFTKRYAELLSARIFYLRGGYAPEKLRGIQKFLMRHMGRSVEKKIQAKGDAATEQDREMVELFRNGGDYVSREALDEIVQWFAEGPHEGMMKASFSLDI